MSKPATCDEWLPKLRKEFGALWACEAVGQSLRIQTPFPTLTSKLVSIFVHQRGGEFIITDGGWLSDADNPYDFHHFEDEQQEAAVAEFLMERHGVKQTFNQAAERIFYKKTDNPSLVSSRVFDVASFASAYVMGMHLSIPLVPPQQPAKPLFRAKASEFLIKTKPDTKLNELLPGIVRYRYHAVRYVDQRIHSVVTYVTGSNRVNFSSELSNANLRARLLQKMSYYRSIKTAAVLFDDQCGGFHKREFDQVFDVIAEVCTHPPFSWSRREELAAVT